MKLVIFDFCDTIVNFQSADAFCRYALNQIGKKRIVVLDKVLHKLKIYRFFSKIGVYKLQKKLLLSGLKGVALSKMTKVSNNFLNDVIENRLNTVIIKKLEQHLLDKDFVLISSGGYNLYLDLFAKKYKVNHLHCTKIESKNNVLTGKISGNDCLGIEKLNRLNHDSKFNKPFSKIIVYSDSVTDMPIFDIADYRYAVISSKNNPKWCSNNKFEIIRISN